MEHFQRKGGVKTVYGFASYGGYPYWRGLYCGAEPVCLTRYTHAWVTFMAGGFTHHQQSINYLGVTEPREYRDDLEYAVSDKYLAKIDFIFSSVTTNDHFDVFHKISPSLVCPPLYPFILHETPEDLNEIQLGR